MRPTFMAFESASRALMASQKALDISLNNLGNIGVSGYTRQRVDMVSMNLNNRYTRFASTGADLAGQGVKVTGVTQIRDSFLDKRFREEYGDVGYYDQLKTTLTDIESALGEIEPAQISEALGKFEAAWKVMNEGEVNSVNANTILSTARVITQVLKQMDTKLSNVWEQTRYDLQLKVDEVNSKLQSIAELNDTIKKEQFSGSQPNELLDKRNVLLDELSEFGDINVKQMGDGTVTVTMAGHTVVEGDEFETLNLVKSKSANTVSVNWQSDGKPVNLGSGSIKGALEMLNGRGADASAASGELFEKGILYYQDKIDKLAGTIAEAFNNTVPIFYTAETAGNDPTLIGKPTGKYKVLFSFSSDELKNTASGIQISTDWEKDPAYIIKDVQKDSEGKYDKSFVSAAMANFSKELNFGEFKGTLNDYVTYYSSSTLGTQLDAANKRHDASASISDDLLDKITNISGVSEQEEGIDMMMYQKAFNAMSRLITILDETMDTLISKTGIIGR